MTDLAAPAVHCDTCGGSGEVPAAFAAPGLGALFTNKACPDPVHQVPVFVLGDIVRVRAEHWPSIIDQPIGKPPTCDPDQLAEVTVCCVPIAHVRPYGDPAGAPRWVQLSDLTHVELDA